MDTKYLRAFYAPINQILFVNCLLRPLYVTLQLNSC